MPGPVLPLAHTQADFVVRLSPSGRLLAASGNVADVLGWDLAVCARDGIVAALGSAAARAAMASLQAQTLATGSSRATVQLASLTGPVWLDIAVCQLDEPGHPLLASARDITTDLAATSALAESERQWRVAFEHSPLAGALIGPDAAVLLANEAMATLLGRPLHELGHLTLADLGVTESWSTWQQWWCELVTGVVGEHAADGRIRTRDGDLLWVRISAAGVPTTRPDERRNVIVQMEDVTERREAELSLADRALHDGLTGLPNRFLTRQWLASALEDHPGQAVGVLYCDLDRFKVVNDSLGHGAGDALLLQVGSRLRAALAPAHLVGRVGGDEFVVVVEGVLDDADLDRVAFELAASLDVPFELVVGQGSQHHAMSLSLGGAIGRHPETADALLARADLALLRAKRQGRARFTPYDEAVDRVATREDLQLEDDLRGSVNADELRVHYQPVVDLRDLAVVGHEALMRWQHPTRGLLLPAQFLDLAESSGLIHQLGRWILGRSCRDAARIADGRHEGVPWVAVNASPMQLARPGLAADVERALEVSGLPAELLHVELTETALITASATLARELHQLAERGVRIVLDDFGTGYSSLSLLRQFPVHVVKIDRSFVAPLLTDRSAYAIVKAVIGMCHDLGLPTVAEGIEQREQLAALRELGCTHGQGFLFGRPVERDPAPRRLVAVPQRRRDDPAVAASGTAAMASGTAQP